jgi:hypothetical protein
MDEQTPAVETLPNPSSLFTRISNVFASPGEVFSELAVQPVQTSSWMIPLLLMIIMMMGTTLFMFSNETLRNQAMEKQHQAIQKMVDEGKLTQEQADQQEQLIAGSKLVTIFAAGGALGMAVVIFFVIPFVLWICAKLFLHFGGGYLKIVEMYGLSSIIGFLGGIVTALMMNIFGTMYASPGAWLAIMQSYNPQNFVHTIISAINVFSLWQVAIVGIGLAKVSKKETGSGMGLAFALYVILVLVIAGIGQMFK